MHHFIKMTSSLNDSFLSVCEKSELDIELELCEELLEKDINGSNEVEYNEFPSETNEVEYNEFPSETNEVEYNEFPSETNEVLPDIYPSELLSENNACVENSHKLYSEKNELAINNSHDLPSEEDEFDFEIKKCYNILKLEKPTDPDILSLFCESDLEEIEISILECENTSSIDINDEVENQDEAQDMKLMNHKENCIKDEESNIKYEPKDFNLDTNLFNNEEKDKNPKENYTKDEASNIKYEPKAFNPDTNLFNNEEKDKNHKANYIKDETSNIKCEPKDFNPDTNLFNNESIKLNDETKDINDPGWEAIKNLSTSEQRHKQVRKCWESSTVPDPNRNLTYHSYRKRHFRHLKVVPKTRKRAATSNLDVSMLNPAKRQRSCTFLYDQNIDSLSAEKDQKKRDLFNEMDCEVRHLNSILFHQEQRLQRQYEYNGRHNSNAYGQLYNLREKCQREIECVQQQYMSRANECTAELQYDINELNNARDEVLQFYNFYKGYNSNDPTVLTTSQLQELDEIENVFSQFDKLYN